MDGTVLNTLFYFYKFEIKFKTLKIIYLELKKVDELEIKRNYNEFLKRRGKKLQGF